MHYSSKSPINIISIFSIIGWVALVISPWMIQFGMSSSPVTPLHRVLQFFAYWFLHGGLWHILSNVFFFLVIGKTVEVIHGNRYIWLLWWWTTLFVGVILMHYSDAFTIGASGFAMALLVVYTIDLYRWRRWEYKTALLLLAINIAIGFDGNISLLGHLFGAIAGAIFTLFPIKSR